LDANTLYAFRVTASAADYEAVNDTATATTSSMPVKEPLGTPTGVKQTGKTDTTVTLIWEPDTHATGYIIEYAADTNFTDIIGSQNSNTAVAEITGLMTGTGYYIRVKATTTTGDFENSEWSNPEFVTTSNLDDEPLGTPTGIVLDGRTTETLDIRWTDVPGAAGYEIQWAASIQDFENGNYVTKHSNTASCIITGLTHGTAYFVRIMAITTADGFANSVWSTPVEFETIEDTPIFDPTPTPDTNSVTISWSAGTQPDNGKIQFKESSSSEWITWSGDAVGNSIAIPGLKSGTAYDFRVLDISGEQVGQVIQETTKADSGTLAVPPVKPKASVVKRGEDKPTINSVTLTWDAIPKKATAESNVVYIITCTSDSSITPIAVAGTGKLSHTFTGLKPNTSYKFTVTAVNADGRSIDAKDKSPAVMITAKTIKY